MVVIKVNRLGYTLQRHCLLSIKREGIPKTLCRLFFEFCIPFQDYLDPTEYCCGLHVSLSDTIYARLLQAPTLIAPTAR